MTPLSVDKMKGIVNSTLDYRWCCSPSDEQDIQRLADLFVVHTSVNMKQPPTETAFLLFLGSEGLLEELGILPIEAVEVAQDIISTITRVDV